MQSRLIGALFVERGVITAEQLERALELQAAQGGRLGEILVAEFGISRVELASILAEQWAEAERGAQADGGEPVDNGPPVAQSPAQDVEATEPVARRPIGEIFVERGLVTDEQLQAALEAQRQSGGRLGEILVEQGMLSRLDLAGALADQWASLQKLRPPEPKPVEPWQQAAPRELTIPSAPEPRAIETDSIASAVRALEERVSAAEASSALDSWREELRSAADGLTARIAALEARIDGLAAHDDRAALESIRGTVVELRERLEQPDPRLDAVEARLEATATAENLRHGLGAMEQRLGGLEQRLAADEGRIEGGLASSLERTAGLTNELRERLASLERRVAELAAAEETGASAAVGHVAARLDALSGLTARRAELEDLRSELAALQERHPGSDAAPVADGLAERLDRLEARLADVASRAELESLAAELRAEAGDRSPGDGLAAAVESLWERVDGLAAGAVRGGDLEAVRAELQELRVLASSTVGHERLDELGSRLDELGARLGGAVSRDELASLTHELRERVDGLAADAVRGGELEAVRAELQELRVLASSALGDDQLAGLSGRLDELGARLHGAVSRDELASLAHELREQLAEAWSRLDAVAGLQGDELLATVESLRQRVDGLAADAARGWDLEAVRAELQELRVLASSAVGHERLDELGRRLDELGARLGSAVSQDELTSLTGELRERLAEAWSRLEGTAEHTSGVEGRVAEIESRLETSGVLQRDVLASTVDGLLERVDAVAAAAARRDEVEALRAELSALRDRADRGGEGGGNLSPGVEELVRAVEEATRVSGDARQLAAGAAAAKAELEHRVEGLATDMAREWDLESLRSQLQALEGVTASERVSVHHRIDELEAALAQAAKRAESIEPQQLAGIAGELEALREAIDGRAPSPWLDELARRVGELAAGQEDGATRVELTALAGDLRAQLTTLSARIESSAPSLESLREASAAGLHDAIADLEARLDDRDAALRAEQAETVGTLQSRLSVGEGSLEELRSRVEELHTALADRDEWRGRVEAGIARRVDELSENAASTAETAASMRDGLQAELAERLDVLGRELRGELANLERRVDESDRANAGSARVALEELRRVSDRVVGVEAGLAHRLDELARSVESGAQDVAGLRGDTDAQATRMEELRAELAVGLDELARSLREELSQLGQRADDADAQLERAAGSITWRLEQVEHSLGDADVSGVATRLDALEARLEEGGAITDEHVRATERALRKGLAALGERLTEAEGAYAESGNALRRSIERLGSAIAEADIRIAERDDPVAIEQHAASATSHVAFAPTEDGYRLVACDGPAPSVGGEVELGGRRLRCTRIGVSPLPLDRRPCAYLEPVL